MLAHCLQNRFRLLSGLGWDSALRASPSLVAGLRSLRSTGCATPSGTHTPMSWLPLLAALAALLAGQAAHGLPREPSTDHDLLPGGLRVKAAVR